MHVYRSETVLMVLACDASFVRGARLRLGVLRRLVTDDSPGAVHRIREPNEDLVLLIIVDRPKVLVLLHDMRGPARSFDPQTPRAEIEHAIRHWRNLPLRPIRVLRFGKRPRSAGRGGEPHGRIAQGNQFIL